MLHLQLVSEWSFNNLLNSLCVQVAKSVSLRLYNELEVVQKKNSQLEWENETLREKTQEQEVAKQVLQAEMDKAREVSYWSKMFCLRICLQAIRFILFIAELIRS